MNKLALLKSGFALVVVASTLNSVAFAQGKSDVFNRNTGPMTGGASSQMPISGNAALGKNDPVSRWFDDYDGNFHQYGKVPLEEQGIMARSFKGDAKRVEEWSKVVNKIAHQYHNYAHVIRSQSIPSGIGPAARDLQSFRTQAADYYDDTADYYEDWIRPRRPAVTREELQQQLDEMHTRSQDLQLQLKNLLTTDQTLRTQYDVRGGDDALMHYVAKKPAK